jgi:6-phosphofructokinase 1
VLGIRYGFRGFYDKTHKPVPLTKKTVDGIQLTGGTILGTSRGGANIKCGYVAAAAAAAALFFCLRGF